MIDSKPDRPEDLVMITLNTDYVSLDLYHGLTKKINGNHTKDIVRKENCADQTTVCAVLCLVFEPGLNQLGSRRCCGLRACSGY